MLMNAASRISPPHDGRFLARRGPTWVGQKADAVAIVDRVARTAATAALR